MTKFPAKIVVFDLDGTLIDTAVDLHAATNHVLKSLNIAPATLEQVRPYVGFGAIKLIETGLELSGNTTKYNAHDYKDMFLSYYSNHISVHSRLFSGGSEMLNTLQGAGVKMAICTNKPLGLAQQLLGDLGLSSYFEAITGGDSFPYKKPDPRHLQETIKLMGIKGPAVMVGDSSPDILCAKAAGIPVIAANYGYPDQPILSLGPDACITSLSDLVGLLDL
ncbi:phosphoglycolate phosphatase [Kordiimonas pumila]|uniref:phosphoglycolate phosphatase n=1 Tax=Kordiimonas pumila TaxID=2161677 RepID=A0ABV7D201_9PROT|nr:phosphoglycolate phosphatase [Kordiimonas pumila]